MRRSSERQEVDDSLRGRLLRTSGGHPLRDYDVDFKKVSPPRVRRSSREGRLDPACSWVHSARAEVNRNAVGSLSSYSSLLRKGGGHPCSRRTGWSIETSAPNERTLVFSARAEVILDRAAYTRGRERLLRACGGHPRTERASHILSKSSPRERRSSVGDLRPGSDRLVFSAGAEVILTIQRWRHGSESPLRPRGGHPHKRRRPKNRRASTPHRRRSSGPGDWIAASDRVSSAGAEVAHEHPGHEGRNARLLRKCGGHPEEELQAIEQELSTPHRRRRSSSLPMVLLSRTPVSSACAEVILLRRRLRVLWQGLLCPRGSHPIGSRCCTSTWASAPPARRSSGRLSGPQVPWVVSARAEVIQEHGRPADPRPGLLRKRGGSLTAASTDVIICETT